MPLPTALRALAHRDFRLFWSGQLVSLIGTWMQSVGQAWLVLELTNSPLRLGLLGTLQFGPILLFSFMAGAISDRIPKRRLLVGTQSALMLQAFALSGLVWSGQVQYWHIAVLASLYGLVNTLDMPARQAYIADLVGREDLTSAIALNSAVFNGARVVGPAAAGLLVARYGPAAAFFFNGVSFVAVIVALLAVRTHGWPRPRATPSSIVQDIVEGVRYAVGTPRIALVLSLLLTVSLFVVNFNVLVPLLAREVLHEGAHGFGLLMASLGAGAVVGALTPALLGMGRPPVSLLIGASATVSAGTLALALARSFWPAALILAIIGCNSTLQMTSPDELRGRMMSLYTVGFAGMTPIGSLLVGALAEVLGVPATCAAGGGLGLLIVAGLSL